MWLHVNHVAIEGEDVDSFIQQVLLAPHHVADTVLGAEDTSMRKTKTPL